MSVDLVADGPHAIVAGTTGSGKSELLVSWVLALAALRSPRELRFLLVDFKGGAAFAPLAGLPHVLGTVNDLDPRRARRAIESLRAELRRREAVLAGARARSIEELTVAALPRLVVVVDEFAAVVAEQAELHAVFGDLAARGRSLGIHLVLCTQRPGGVVRDAVLANVPLRLSLRVADRADSSALLGGDAAARLPPLPRGRAVLGDGSGEVRVFQVALAAPSDPVRFASRHSEPDDGCPPPWCEPLPEVLRVSDLRRGPGAESFGVPFGLADLPAEQRQPIAAHDPVRHGPLLVLGAARSGRTTALETLALADPGARWLPSEPGALWDVLVADRFDAGGLLLLDDLDLLIARCDADHRTDLVDLLGRRVREGAPRWPLVIAAHRLGGPLATVAAQVESRLVLRQSSRDDHLLAGAPPTDFDPRIPPGSGWWRGAAVQVALADRPAARRPIEVPEVPYVGPGWAPVLAVVSTRAAALRNRFADVGARVVLLGEESASEGPPPGQVDGPAATVVLGDPDAWQADFGMLTRARRDYPILLEGCSLADHRAVTRSRDLPPPLDRAVGDCWLVAEGRTRRARLGPAPD